MASAEEEMVGMINDLSAEFDQLIFDRHTVGQQKYGQLSFLGKDMFLEAFQELADTANYVRYQYIKLRMLQDLILADKDVEKLAMDGTVSIGLESFTPTAKG